jgi:hypothetical protein
LAAVLLIRPYSVAARSARALLLMMSVSSVSSQAYRSARVMRSGIWPTTEVSSANGTLPKLSMAW